MIKAYNNHFLGLQLFLRCNGYGSYTEPVGGICVAHQAVSTEHFAELAQSLVSPTGHRSTIQDGQVESIYPQSYWPETQMETI
jgi:hypothetical protein